MTSAKREDEEARGPCAPGTQRTNSCSWELWEANVDSKQANARQGKATFTKTGDCKVFSPALAPPHSLPGMAQHGLGEGQPCPEPPPPTPTACQRLRDWSLCHLTGSSVKSSAARISQSESKSYEQPQAWPGKTARGPPADTGTQD